MAILANVTVSIRDTYFQTHDKRGVEYRSPLCKIYANQGAEDVQILCTEAEMKQIEEKKGTTIQLPVAISIYNPQNGTPALNYRLMTGGK